MKKFYNFPLKCVAFNQKSQDTPRGKTDKTKETPETGMMKVTK